MAATSPTLDSLLSFTHTHTQATHTNTNTHAMHLHIASHAFKSLLYQQATHQAHGSLEDVCFLLRVGLHTPNVVWRCLVERQR